MADRQQAENPSPEEQVRALYERAESETTRAFEELVSRPSFGLLLARSAENVAALTRIASDMADLVLRNLRLAGRADITRLARQLHRTEDKLEHVLQEVEALRDELAIRGNGAQQAAGGSRRGSSGSSGARSGRRSANGGSGRRSAGGRS